MDAIQGVPLHKGYESKNYYLLYNQKSFMVVQGSIVL